METLDLFLKIFYPLISLSNSLFSISDSAVTLLNLQVEILDISIHSFELALKNFNLAFVCVPDFIDFLLGSFLLFFSGFFNSFF